MILAFRDMYDLFKNMKETDVSFTAVIGQYYSCMNFPTPYYQLIKNI